MLSDEGRRALALLLDREQVVTDPVALITYEIDAGLDRGAPDAVVFPRSAADVERIVRWAAEYHVPLIARGAGTGLSGGAVAEHGGVIVACSRLDRIIEVDARGRSALVEPGVVNQRLDETARANDLYYPPDPASGRSSTIGGNVAENAGGPHCFKYGVTTNYVTGLEVALAGGRLVQLGGRALDYPEYDLCGLVVGSEGCLGIVTLASVRLVRNPPAAKTLMAIFDSVEQAGTAVSAVIAAGLIPATMEMMDQKITQIIEDYVHAGLPTDAGAVLIVDVDGYPASLDPQIAEISRILREHGTRDLRVAGTAEEREKIWYARKSAAGAMSRLAPAYYLVDASVPRSQLAAVLAEINAICDRHGVRAGYVFHAGDGNLHPLILIDDPSNQALMERVVAAGRESLDPCLRRNGSISGEHGVGIEKRVYMPLMYTPDELWAMRKVKEAFDPANLLNPGKVLPKEETTEEAPAQSVAKTVEAAAGFQPVSAADAAAVLSACLAARRPIRICGGPPPAESLGAPPVLSAQRLAGIKGYAPDDLFVTAGAGTRLVDLQEFLARDGAQVPLVSPWPETTLGGLIATNLNAPLRMRYGGIRDLALAMTVVLGNGRVIRAGRPVVKNVAGLDLPKVFVGSGGTLGLITDLTLKIARRPRACRTLLVPIAELKNGLSLGSGLLSRALVASAIVLFKAADLPGLPQSPYLLAYTAEGLTEDVEAELAHAVDLLSGAGAKEIQTVENPSGTELWAALLRRAGGDSLLVRGAVAPKDLPAFVGMQSAALSESSFLVDFAAGMVYTVPPESNGDQAGEWLESLRRAAMAAGGYAVLIGTDQAKGETKWRGYRPAGYEIMRRLKEAWDPSGILNPDAAIVSEVPVGPR